MKCNALCLCGVTMLAAAVAVGSLAFAGEPTKPATDAAKDAVKKGTDAAKDAAHGATGGAPQMDPKMAEAMKRMEAYGALNENHAYLKQFEGEWDCAFKWWMVEGTPAIESKFTASAKMALDGRFLIEKVQGNMLMAEGMPPTPFTGMSILGYDNEKKQFTSAWMDNMMTGTMQHTGSASQGGKVFTFEGDNYCPMNGKICQFKSVCTLVDANTRKFEMWGPGLDGKVFKAMEMTYTRKK